MNGRNHGKFRKILIGYDGSTGATRALEGGLSVARGMDSTVEVLAVAHPAEPATAVDLQSVINDAYEHYEKDLERLLKHSKRKRYSDRN